MKSLQEFINEMASNKFDLKHAFEYYKIFGIITDDPIKELNEGKLSKEKLFNDCTMIQLWDQPKDNNNGGIINVDSILEDLVKNPPKGAIVWIVTERSKNSKCINDNKIWKMILKGTYNGKELDNKQIVISESEDLLPKELHDRLNPFIKI